MNSKTFVVNGEVLPSVYGPVQSRRHGLSLGVNVGLTEHKICTWSCLYCQCGFGERRDFNAKEVRVEVIELLAKIKNKVLSDPAIEAITLAGNTEPGTYPDLLQLIKGLQRLKLACRAQWQIVILSNGSELDRDEVVQAFNMADQVWLKLDTGTEAQFHALNRPMPKVGQLSDHLQRLRKLRNLRIQTLIWSHEDGDRLSNANEANFAGLLESYAELKPLQVNLTTIARNPAMPGIVPVSKELLQNFAIKIRQLGIAADILI